MTTDRKPRRKRDAMGRAQDEIEQAERYEAKAARCREVAASIIATERAKAQSILDALPL
jgi:hypothetical protein